MTKRTSLDYAGWAMFDNGRMIRVESRSKAGAISELSRQARHAQADGLSPVTAEVALPNGNNTRLRWVDTFGSFFAND